MEWQWGGDSQGGKRNCSPYTLVTVGEGLGHPGHSVGRTTPLHAQPQKAQDTCWANPWTAT